MGKKLSVFMVAAILMLGCLGLVACGNGAKSTVGQEGSSGNGKSAQGQSTASSNTKSEEFAVGSTVTLGSYEQDNKKNNGTEPITWLVLDVKDGKALLVSEAGLDSKQFNSVHREFKKSERDRAWETSDLKSWLEGTFLSEAFTAEEQSRIDTITCLSSDEAEQYFSSDNDRKCFPTPYALANGASTSDDGVSAWWLRTPCSSVEYSPEFVNIDGQIDVGLGETHKDMVVRPAVWVNLD